MTNTDSFLLPWQPVFIKNNFINRKIETLQGDDEGAGESGND